MNSAYKNPQNETHIFSNFENKCSEIHKHETHGTMYMSLIKAYEENALEKVPKHYIDNLIGFLPFDLVKTLHNKKNLNQRPRQ